MIDCVYVLTSIVTLSNQYLLKFIIDAWRVLLHWKSLFTSVLFYQFLTVFAIVVCLDCICSG